MGGISLDQLRWMLSSYSIQELGHEGVDVNVEIPFSDGDDTTHLWSELNENCTREEIHIAHVASETGTMEYLKEFVLTGQEEQIQQDRIAYLATDLNDLAEHVSTSNTALAIVYLGDTLSDALQDHIHKTQLVSIRGADGEMKKPIAEYIEGDDFPLSTDIYMGVYNDPTSLQLTKPYLEYGMSEEGTKTMQEAGFWPVHRWEMIVMETRLQTVNGVPLHDIKESCGPKNQRIRMAGSVEAMTVAKIWSEIYHLGCSVDIEVEGGGNSAGAGRVCANEVHGDPVDIGIMSREWNNEEGMPHPKLEYVY
jgi:ABC-type phosphate transport system substrate-binding protein